MFAFPHSLRSRRTILVVGTLLASVLLVAMGPSSVASKQPDTTGKHGGTGGGLIVAEQPAPLKPTTRTSTPPQPLASPPGAKPPPKTPLPVPTTAPSRPAPAPLSAEDKLALGKIDFWWDVFATAIKQNKRGTKLTARQLKKPDIVIVKKSTCQQPATNVLGPKSRTSLTYCNGKLELVPSVFLTITDGGQLKVVASGFLYHALATTPAKLRQWRNNTQVLGCLQATLSTALLRYDSIQTENEAWAVMRDNMGGGDLHDSYFATMNGNGSWR